MAGFFLAICWTPSLECPILKNFTVEALVSDHLGNSKKRVVTRAGRLQEYALVSDPMVKQ